MRPDTKINGYNCSVLLNMLKHLPGSITPKSVNVGALYTALVVLLFIELIYVAAIGVGSSDDLSFLGS